MQQAIAILDSGVGGLTVVKEVMRQMPGESIVYFGDTARAPYGARPPEEVVRFTEEIVRYLTQFKPKMIVIACNTATALAIDRIRDIVDIPVVGVIEPGARAAIRTSKNGFIGVIGTDNTIRSGAYRRALQNLSPDVRVASLACPRLVPLVERGDYRSGHAKLTVEESLAPLLHYPIDCLILGCTHYPFLAEAISATVGPGVTLINSAEETAKEIRDILSVRGGLSSPDRMPVHYFYCSGRPSTFRRIAKEWLGRQIRVAPIVWQLTRFADD